MATAARLEPARRLSVEEYLDLPTDGPRSELIYGELVVSPSPTDEHNDLLHHLGEVLHRWTRHHDLGKVSFDLDMVLDAKKKLIYRPDLLYLTKENQARRKKRVHGPADLCVEILSPSDRPSVRGRKFSDYERYGVRWYWTIRLDEANELELEENELVEGVFLCRTEVVGDAWFSPALFPGLTFRLPPLLAGDAKAAVKGKAKRLM